MKVNGWGGLATAQVTSEQRGNNTLHVIMGEIEVRRNGVKGSDRYPYRIETFSQKQIEYREKNFVKGVAVIFNGDIQGGIVIIKTDIEKVYKSYTFEEGQNNKGIYQNQNAAPAQPAQIPPSGYQNNYAKPAPQAPAQQNYQPAPQQAPAQQNYQPAPQQAPAQQNYQPALQQAPVQQAAPQQNYQQPTQQQAPQQVAQQAPVQQNYQQQAPVQQQAQSQAPAPNFAQPAPQAPVQQQQSENVDFNTMFNNQQQ